MVDIDSVFFLQRLIRQHWTKRVSRILFLYSTKSFSSSSLQSRVRNARESFGVLRFQLAELSPIDRTIMLAMFSSLVHKLCSIVRWSFSKHTWHFSSDVVWSLLVIKFLHHLNLSTHMRVSGKQSCGNNSLLFRLISRPIMSCLWSHQGRVCVCVLVLSINPVSLNYQSWCGPRSLNNSFICSVARLCICDYSLCVARVRFRRSVRARYLTSLSRTRRKDNSQWCWSIALYPIDEEGRKYTGQTNQPEWEYRGNTKECLTIRRSILLRWHIGTQRTMMNEMWFDCWTNTGSNGEFLTRESPASWNRKENTASRASRVERTETNASIRVNRDYIIRWPLTLTDDLIVREESEGHWSYRVYDYSISSERAREERKREKSCGNSRSANRWECTRTERKEKNLISSLALRFALFFVLFRSFSR